MEKLSKRIVRQLYDKGKDAKNKTEENLEIWGK